MAVLPTDQLMYANAGPDIGRVSTGQPMANAGLDIGRVNTGQQNMQNRMGGMAGPRPRGGRIQRGVLPTIQAPGMFGQSMQALMARRANPNMGMQGFRFPQMGGYGQMPMQAQPQPMNAVMNPNTVQIRRGY